MINVWTQCLALEVFYPVLLQRRGPWKHAILQDAYDTAASIRMTVSNPFNVSLTELLLA